MTVSSPARHSNVRQRVVVRLLDVIRIVRVLSCLAGAATVVLGIRLSGGSVVDNARPLTLAAASIAAAIAVANVVNDIMDVAVDSTNKSDRPLPSGRMSRIWAAGLAVILATIALTLSAAAGGRLSVWMAILLSVAVGYSFWLKGTIFIGNVVVALCASVPVVFGAALAGRYPTVVWAAVGLVFLFMLTNEVLKTIADRDADARAGLSTFATVLGVRASVRLFRILVILLTIGGLAATAVSAHPDLYVIVALSTFVAPSWTAVRWLGSTPDPASMRRPVYLMRFSWFIGMSALWLLA